MLLKLTSTIDIEYTQMGEISTPSGDTKSYIKSTIDLQISPENPVFIEEPKLSELCLDVSFRNSFDAWVNEGVLTVQSAELESENL